MSYAYDELYLPLAQRMMGDMYDFAVNTLHYKIAEFHKMFLVCGVAAQIEKGNPTYLAGKNGCEVAKTVIERSTGIYPETEEVMYLDKSAEYWIGWALAYFQWESNIRFRKIEERVHIEEFYSMYPTYHEADINIFSEFMNKRCQDGVRQSQLKRIRTYMGLSQKGLAQQAGVSIRQIQLFEQGQRDIRKAQTQTLVLLSNALHCSIENII